ncbi:MAG: hypothetical protein LBF27_12980 [Sphingobacterium sp.]|jgi:uncharacterized repeat protein (TIGR03806 family)|nr:hypothetical protein [Sphingobacterium sp.]
MKKAIILIGVLLIPILFIVLNNKDRGKIAADNFIFLDKLSDYGLFQGKMADLIPNDRAVSYELASALFTDYADKKRFIFLPKGTHLVASDDGLPVFPDGTIISKTFYYPQQANVQEPKSILLETRLLINKDGQWNAATYQWNSSQDEAFLLTDSASVPVSFLDNEGVKRQTNYIIPSRTDCIACHRQGNHMLPIGPKIKNLNRIVVHKTDTLQQLAYWQDKGIIDMSPLKQFSSLPNYDDNNQSIEKRARAYLEVNCAHCHNPIGTAYMTMLDLRFESPINETGIWLKQAKIIGRMSVLGEMHMPQKGTTILHAEGIALVRDYLHKLK